MGGKFDQHHQSVNNQLNAARDIVIRFVISPPHGLALFAFLILIAFLVQLNTIMAFYQFSEGMSLFEIDRRSSIAAFTRAISINPSFARAYNA